MTPVEKPPIFAVIPPPAWFAIYFALAAAASALGLDFRIEQLHRPMIGNILSATALILALSAIALFHKDATQINPASSRNDKLVLRGPYRFTRNPMYLAILVLALGLAIRMGAAVYFIVPVLSFITNDKIVIPYEERKMEAQYGDVYRAYKAKVRRWI